MRIAGRGEDMGFADLVMNMLAVLLLVTVILALSATVLADTRRTDDAGPVDDDGDHRAIPRPALVPFATHVLVHEDGIGVLPLDAIAGVIAADGFASREVRGAVWGDERGGPLTFTIAAPGAGSSRADRDEADLNTYRLRLAIEAGRRDEYPDADGATTAEMLLDQAVADRSVLHFIVTPSGHDRFADIFAALDEQGACFRWTPWSGDGTFALSRSPGQFTTFSRRRCRIEVRP